MRRTTDEALVRHGVAFQVWVLSTGVGDMDKGRWRIDGDITVNPNVSPKRWTIRAAWGSVY